jgi:acyl-coenzyme A thioesterase PaaI-like protein
MSEPRPSTPPAGFEPPVAYDASFDAVYGLEVLEEDPEAGSSRARIEVRPEIGDHRGAVAGGVLAAAAEAIASRGTWRAVMPRLVAQGLSNDTTAFAPVTSGHVDVAARVVGRTDTEWVWSIEFADAAGGPCGLSRVTVAVRPMR